MREEQKGAVKNSIGRIFITALLVLIQVVWIIELFVRLNKYSTGISLVSGAIALIVKEQPRRQREDDAYITISGFQSICQKVVRMLDQAQCRIYMTGTASMLEMFREKLEVLVSHEIKVVLITEPVFELAGAIIYHSDHIENGQIGLISDSTHVLTGDLSENDSCSCLYSGKKNLIDLFKQSLSRQIRLIELGQQEKGSNR